MPRKRRPEYDSAEFRARWMAGETLESLSSWLGVHPSAIWKAANRRGLPGKYRNGADRGIHDQDNWRQIGNIARNMIEGRDR